MRLGVDIFDYPCGMLWLSTARATLPVHLCPTWFYATCACQLPRYVFGTNMVPKKELLTWTYKDIHNEHKISIKGN
jgi:hypothetical protein